jgi:hypothetical protein
MRKGELILNYSMVLVPLVFGMFLVRFMGLYYSMPKIAFWIIAGLILLGFVLFAKAKFSIIKQGQLFTFGPSKMSKSNRIEYFIGYGGMCIGFFLLIVFSLVV